MEKKEGLIFTGERALFGAKKLNIYESVFEDGESPLKESSDIYLKDVMFGWKYPIWYSKKISIDNCTFFETARAGMWYTEDINIKNTIIEAPKTFRRSFEITLENVSMPNADETLWHCRNVKITSMRAKGDYFAMNSSDMEINNIELYGNYSFDGAKNVVIRNSKLLSKDAFWNSENITVYDSLVSGEYLGWNAKNLTLINCTIESRQGMCYIENLVMKNCKTVKTTLAFEYSSVDVEIKGNIDSIKNAASGYICAGSIGETIMEKDKVDTDKTEIFENGACVSFP